MTKFWIKPTVFLLLWGYGFLSDQNLYAQDFSRYSKNLASIGLKPIAETESDYETEVIRSMLVGPYNQGHFIQLEKSATGCSYQLWQWSWGKGDSNTSSLKFKRGSLTVLDWEKFRKKLLHSGFLDSSKIKNVKWEFKDGVVFDGTTLYIEAKLDGHKSQLSHAWLSHLRKYDKYTPLRKLNSNLEEWREIELEYLFPLDWAVEIIGYYQDLTPRI